MNRTQRSRSLAHVDMLVGEEAFGEDPMLISLMGVAAVSGLSGPGKAGAASTYIQRPDIHIATEVGLLALNNKLFVSSINMS